MSKNIKEQVDQIKKEIKTLYNAKKYQEVIERAEKALALDDHAYEVMCIAAAAYIEFGDYDKALSLSNQMLEIKNDYIEGHLVLAKTYSFRLEYDKAIDVFQNLFLMYENDLSKDVQSFIYSSLGNLYNDLGDTVNGCAYFLKASDVTENLCQKVMEYSRYLLSTHYNNDKSDNEIFAAHARYDAFFKNVSPLLHDKRIEKEKINIGYISADFRDHIVAFFCCELLSNYNKNRYNVICYARGAEDQVTEQLKGLVSEWRDISQMDFDQAAKTIYNDEIDILVDLAGHTGNNCLPILARKPAPIQVSGIGYFNTTGLKAVDYFLTDKYCDPVGKNDHLFVEKLVRLPSSHLCYAARTESVVCAAPPVNRNGFITFGSFNNFCKVTDSMLLLWKNILAKVPNSKLLLKSKPFASRFACQKIKNRLINLGFNEENLEFRPLSDGYLEQYNDVDIALDTFPYPGGGTTCEALYMGVPVITLVGKRHGARFGYSLLKNIGLDDCIAFHENEYIEKAVKLAHNQEKLNDLRKTLRETITKSPVMNGIQYIAEVENCYEEMWQKLLEKNNKVIPKKVLNAKILNKINNLKTKLLDVWRKSQHQQVIKLGGEVLQLNPHDHEVLYVLAEIYYNEKNLEKARSFAERAIEVKSDHIRAYYLLGMTYFLQPNNVLYYEKIINIFTTVFKLKFASLEKMYQSNIYAKLGQIYWELEDLDKCMEYHKKSYELETDDYRKKNYYSAYLFELNHSLAQSKKDIFLAHVEYNKFLSHIIPYKHGERENKKKLRIGYISPDFRMHPVSYFSMALLSKYDKEKFEVYCYSNAVKPDEVTEILKPLVTKWRDVIDKQYEETAKLIYEDQIDILIDLAGHTGNDNLTVLAYKPAPIQLSGIGYINTTGLGTVDYFITDHYCDPEGLNDSYFSEKLLRLPYTHFCYTHIGEQYPCKEAPVQKNNYITFGSFNKFKKVTDEVLALWVKILERVPNSKIVIKAQACSNKYGRMLVKDRLLNAGLKDEQFELRPFSASYMDEYNDIDIALDTYPCSGGTTTFEALYMGTPVVTLVGDSHVSRFGYSILKNLSFEEGIAYNETEYIEKAVHLANDTEKIIELHKTLRMRLSNSPLMDEQQYVRDMETAYIKIWNEEADMKFKKNNKFKYTSKQAKTNQKTFDLDKIHALQQKALQYKAEENYEDALIAISEIFAMDYYNTDIMYELAEIYYLKGDMQRAENWAKKVISFDKKYAKALVILAKVYIKQEDATQWLPILNKLLEKEFAPLKDSVEELLNEVYLPDYKIEIENNYKNLYPYIKVEETIEENVPLKEEVVETKQAEGKIDLSNLKNLLKGLRMEEKKEKTLAEIINDVFVNGLTKQAVEQLNAENIDKVTAEIANHSESEANKINLFNTLAVEFYTYNYMEKVLPLLVKALEIDAHNDQSLKNLGVVLFNLGEKQLAGQYLEAIVQKDIAVIDLVKRIKD